MSSKAGSVLMRYQGGYVAADGERPMGLGQDQGVDAPDGRPETRGG